MTYPPARAHAFRRALAIGALVFCAAFLSAVGPRAAAQSRVADVTTTAVAYNLDIVFVDGAMAGRSLDGGVAGTVDSTGMLTATLTVPSGATSMVTGSISRTLLMVKGKAGTFSLGGKFIARRGVYGGLVALSDGTPTASWLLLPAPAQISLNFAGTVKSGRMRGTVLSGKLTIMADKMGHFHGLLVADNGSTIVAAGHLNFGNLHVTLYLPGGGVIQGVAPQSTDYSSGVGVTAYSGIFTGPFTGDRGIWNAQ